MEFSSINHTTAGNCTHVGLAVGRHAFAWMALGGAMFLASDVLLAWQLFHGSFAGIDELTWINYGAGEMLIVYGAIFALMRNASGKEV